MQAKLGLSEDSPKLYELLFETMEKTGNDFTNTFRALSSVTKIGDNKTVLIKLMDNCAPKEFCINKVKHPHADNPKM
jgi:uncharacterized protein YdiU (UPF0061 family)